MDELADRQGKVLQFIARFTADHGFSPSFKEIGAEFGIRSSNAVNDHLKSLAKKGFITKDEQTARSLVLTTKGRIACGMDKLRKRDELERAAKEALFALDEAAPALVAFGHSAQTRVVAAAALLRKAGVR